MAEAARTLHTIAELAGAGLVPAEHASRLEAVAARYAVAITPDMVRLIERNDPEDPIATAINSLPKHVASRTLGDADVTWRGAHPDTAHLLTGDPVEAVRALKEESGDELQIWGSGDLLRTLLQHGLAAAGRGVHAP